MTPLLTRLNLKNITASKLFSTLLLCTMAAMPLSSSAKIYKTIDKHGNVRFTDKHSSDAKEFDLPPDPVVVIPPRSKDSDDEETPRLSTEYEHDAIDEMDAKVVYEAVDILVPHPNEVLHNIGAILPVAVRVVPPLEPDAALLVFLDGHKVARIRGIDRDVIEFDIPDVFRGVHELQVHVVRLNKPRELLISSPKVVFTVQQRSIAKLGKKSKTKPSKKPHKV